MLVACNVCFIKTINYIELQKYLFGINGLTGQLEALERIALDIVVLQDCAAASAASPQTLHHQIPSSPQAPKCSESRWEAMQPFLVGSSIKVRRVVVALFSRFFREGPKASLHHFSSVGMANSIQFLMVLICQDFLKSSWYYIFLI